MKPVKTPATETTFILPGGNEDNDLPVHHYDEQAGGPSLGSTWVPTDEERTQIALGANIELIVWGEGHPPVSIRVADYKVPDYRPPYRIHYPRPQEKEVRVIERLECPEHGPNRILGRTNRCVECDAEGVLVVYLPDSYVAPLKVNVHLDGNAVTDAVRGEIDDDHPES